MFYFANAHWIDFIFVTIFTLQLVSRIPDGLGELKTLLEIHIHNRGIAAIETCAGDNNDPKTYVNTILEVHRKYNCLVLSAFNNDAGRTRSWPNFTP